MSNIKIKKNVLSNEWIVSELNNDHNYNYIDAHIGFYNNNSNIVEFNTLKFGCELYLNDIKLDSRESKEMRLICYSVDTNCKPATKRISDPELEKFGFIQYESPISSLEFSKLSPRDRYRVNFEVFGIAPQEIPERFIGGNPYYN
jgi:hypothetical protein